MKSYGRDESTYSTRILVGLFLHSFRRQILVVHDDRLGDIAITEVNDGRSAE